MQRIGEHAVVIGASVAGLFAARALTDAYDRVTVIERDRLPAGDEGRRAVPQGAHTHALLPQGQVWFEALLPGIVAELGGGRADLRGDVADARGAGRPALRARRPGLRSLLASRPLLEGHIRRRVRALPGVELRDGCDAAGLLAGDDGRIAGVRVLARADGSTGEALAADLVVCAGGARRGCRPGSRRSATRGPRRSGSPSTSPTPRGRCGSPRARWTATASCSSARGPTGRGPVPVRAGGRALAATLAGYGAHHPPADPEAWAAFAATVAPPAVRDAIATAEPLGDIVTHRFPASVRRRYDRLPDGLVVCGDALCVFNPVYGAGMTVAAAEALALRDCLADGSGDLGRRFLAAAAPASTTPGGSRRAATSRCPWSPARARSAYAWSTAGSSACARSPSTTRRWPARSWRSWACASRRSTCSGPPWPA